MARSPRQAPALVLALATLGPVPPSASLLQRIALGFGDAFARDMQAARAALGGLHASLRLPLAELAFPMLRRCPKPLLERLADAMEALPRALDGEITAQEARERLRQQVGRRFRQGRPAGMIDAHDVAYQRMGTLMRARAAFDLAAEPRRCHDRYGPRPLGRDCLLARRLIEHGVSFVRVQHQRGGGWDKHRNIFRS